MPKPIISTACSLIVAAIFAAMLPHLTAAQPPAPVRMPPAASAPSPGLDCFPYLINMSDCLTFVENGSNLTTPEKACCPELAHLVDTQPVCLCRLLGDPRQTGFPIDVSRALKLPSVCNVTAPPVSLCSAGSSTPTASPSPRNGDNGSTSHSVASNRNILIGSAALLFTCFF